MIVAALALVAVAVAAGVAFLVLTRPPAPVSVPDVINRFRTASPAASTPTGRLPPHPLLGVYVYATEGSERISAGITHRYPRQTTVTITASGCGLQVRWDALAGRRSVAQVCVRQGGWQMVSYTDVHTFLYMEDVHAYTCDPPVATGDGSTTTCRGTGTEVTSTLQRMPSSGGVRRVRITQHGTGKSQSDGTIDAWLLPDGLPQRLDITDHGSQRVLGSVVTYDEKASFTLTSQTPRR